MLNAPPGTMIGPPTGTTLNPPLSTHHSTHTNSHINQSDSLGPPQDDKITPKTHQINGNNYNNNNTDDIDQEHSNTTDDLIGHDVVDKMPIHFNGPLQINYYPTDFDEIPRTFMPISKLKQASDFFIWTQTGFTNCGTYKLFVSFFFYLQFYSLGYFQCKFMPQTVMLQGH